VVVSKNLPFRLDQASLVTPRLTIYICMERVLCLANCESENHCLSM